MMSFSSSTGLYPSSSPHGIRNLGRGGSECGIAVRETFMRKLWLLLLMPIVLKAAPSEYHVVGEIMIGGEGGWDYLTVDSTARHSTSLMRRISWSSI
jgi:hypothetical protein